MRPVPAGVLAFLAGNAVMSIELTAVRLLAPHFGDSAVVWTNVIGVILVALAVGAWLGGRWADAERGLSRLSALLALGAMGRFAVALVAPRRFCLADVRTDPRWALVLGALLIAVIAAGGNLRSAVSIDLMGEGGPAAWPDPYAFLAAYIPGLSQVRVPANIWVTGQVALAILAGLGAAACVRWAPRQIRTWVAVLLTLIVWTSTLRPSWLGLSPRAPFALLEMRPSADVLNFYDRLSELGNAGPLLEFPLGQAALPAMSQQVLLTAYHGRRTSGCYASVLPAATASVRELATRLVPGPSTGALGELRELGFSTIVVHHGGARGKGSITARLDRLASAEAAPFRPLHETPNLSAYRIVPAPR